MAKERTDEVYSNTDAGISKTKALKMRKAPAVAASKNIGAANHARSKATLDERLDYVEKLLGDSADKHAVIDQQRL